MGMMTGEMDETAELVAHPTLLRTWWYLPYRQQNDDIVSLLRHDISAARKCVYAEGRCDKECAGRLNLTFP